VAALSAVMFITITITICGDGDAGLEKAKQTRYIERRRCYYTPGVGSHPTGHLL
jgi:hypothetical protein